MSDLFGWLTVRNYSNQVPTDDITEQIWADEMSVAVTY